jgi:hypothetical protein
MSSRGCNWVRGTEYGKTSISERKKKLKKENKKKKYKKAGLTGFGDKRFDETTLFFSPGAFFFLLFLFAVVKVGLHINTKQHDRTALGVGDDIINTGLSSTLYNWNQTLGGIHHRL